VRQGERQLAVRPLGEAGAAFARDHRAMRLLHAADLHLDSPLRGLERYEGAPVDQIRGATRRAFENLIELCLAERVDALLLAGDLYDGDWKDYGTGLFFAAQLARLRESGTRVYIIRGNHDAASQVTRSLKLPEHCRDLYTGRPESVLDEALGLAIHGQGFATREVSEDLAAEYPEAVPGLLNVGLLHTSLNGRPGHAAYAPTSLATLRSKGYDYWALGHVHEREVVSTDPWVVFPGNLQGRHARETGAKGATLVEVVDGRIRSVTHRDFDVVRWARCEIDVSEAGAPSDVLDLVAARLEHALAGADGRLLATRLVLHGPSRAHAALVAREEHWVSEIRACAIDRGGDAAWIEKVQLRTRAEVDLDGLARHDDALGHLIRALRGVRESPAGLLELAGELADLRKALPHELREGEDGLRLDDPEWLAEALADVERGILPRLLSGD